MTNTVTMSTIVPQLRGVSFNGKSIEALGDAIEFAREFTARIDFDYDRCKEWLAVNSLFCIFDEMQGIWE